jgi:hypothetical protein
MNLVNEIDKLIEEVRAFDSQIEERIANDHAPATEFFFVGRRN